MMKVCQKCSISQIYSNFHRNKNHPDGHNKICKVCHKQYTQEYYKKNRDKILENSRRNESINVDRIRDRKQKYYEENKSHILDRSKQYYLNNTEKVQKRTKKNKFDRMQRDAKYRLAANLRTRLYCVLKRNKLSKTSSMDIYLGCTLEELKVHLSHSFQTGMTWDNYGKWHIDHIIPLASATSESEIYQLCHYTNLQPLWAEDNMKKQDKILERNFLNGST